MVLVTEVTIWPLSSTYFQPPPFPVPRHCAQYFHFHPDDKVKPIFILFPAACCHPDHLPFYTASPPHFILSLLHLYTALKDREMQQPAAPDPEGNRSGRVHRFGLLYSGYKNHWPASFHLVDKGLCLCFLLSESPPDSSCLRMESAIIFP